MKKTLLLLCLLFVFLFSNAQMHLVKMKNNTFIPDFLIVVKGDSVMWLNEDTIPHTTASGPDCIADGTYWFSGIINPGGCYKKKMDIPGDFQYHCEYQCENGMLGVINIYDFTVASVHPAADHQLKISTYPNPFTDIVKVDFILPVEGLVKLELCNVAGIKIYEVQESNTISGNHTVSIVSSDFNPGIYICKLYLNGNPAGSEYLVKVAR